jgi:hypothetical protein
MYQRNPVQLLEHLPFWHLRIRTRTQAQPVFVLVLAWGIDDESYGELKRMLRRIVSMLTRLIELADIVSKSSEGYNDAGEYEYRVLSRSTRENQNSPNQDMDRRTRQRCDKW